MSEGFWEICNNLSDRARRVVILYHPRYSIDPNFTNRVVDLTISGQYALIYGSIEHYYGLSEWDGYGTDGNYWPLDGNYRRPIELWKLNSIQSVQIPLPDHKLYLTEDELQKFFYNSHRGSRYYNVADTRCKWLLDPSSTPKYLVGIVTMGLEDISSGTYWSKSFLHPISGIVLVFDQLNDPQFRHRLVLPFEGCEIINPRFRVTKGVELVMEIETSEPPYHNRVYVSDLANDFGEMTPLKSQLRRGRRDQRTHDLFDTPNVYKDFIFNQFKQPVLRNIFENTDFTGDETLPSCLAHHMEGAKLIAVSDTRFLWRIGFGRKCKDQTCPLTKLILNYYLKPHGNIWGYFTLLVEQDFLICSGEGQGWTWNRPKVEIASKRVQIRDGHPVLRFNRNWTTEENRTNRPEPPAYFPVEPELFNRNRPGKPESEKNGAFQPEPPGNFPVEQEKTARVFRIEAENRVPIPGPGTTIRY